MNWKTWLRWIAVPAVCYVSWWLAIGIGLLIFHNSKYFCPVDQRMGDFCTADWFPRFQTGIGWFSAGLGAFLFVLLGSITAPLRNMLVPIGIFCLGLAIVISIGGTDDMPMFYSAAGAGVVAALSLSTSSAFRKRPA